MEVNTQHHVNTLLVIDTWLNVIIFIIWIYTKMNAWKKSLIICFLRTPGWQANVLTNTPKISRDFIVTKSQYLNLVQKTGTFLISAHPIVDSDRACLELPRTVFRSYGISKWPRLDSRQMWLIISMRNGQNSNHRATHVTLQSRPFKWP